MCACAPVAGTPSPAARTSAAAMTPIGLRNDRLPSQRAEHQVQPLLELNRRLPAEQLTCPRDIRLTNLRIVHGQRLVDDLALRPGHAKHGLRELVHRELVRIAEVDR